MKVKEFNIEFVKCDTYSLRIKLNSEIPNITNIRFTAVNTYNDVKIVKTLDDGITINKQDIILTIKPNDTKDCDCTKYFYDVQVEYGFDDNITILKGLMTLSNEISRREGESND